MFSKQASTIKVGDIVRISRKRNLGLVVRSETRIEQDEIRGESYSVEEFDVVKFDGTLVRGSMLNPPKTSYYFNDGSMRGMGSAVAREDVAVVGSAKITTKVNVEYVYNSAALSH